MAELKHVIVTGANGQLGQTYQKVKDLYPRYKFHFFSSSDLDILDIIKLRKVFDDINPDVFINCAAYTAVDNAEDDKEKANTINNLALKYISRICLDRNVLLIHYSSDYVYHSDTGSPLRETSPTTPKGVYAESKLDGEKQILKWAPKAVIIRTSWVYSEFGNNFLKTMLRLGQDRDQLSVVNDQIGAPTYTRDIVNASMCITDQILDNVVPIDEPMIVNYASEGKISWYDFASFIFESANINLNLSGITTEEYPTNALRPKWSVMDMTLIKQTFGIAPRYWKESVKECLEIIIKENS